MFVCVPECLKTEGLSESTKANCLLVCLCIDILEEEPPGTPIPYGVCTVCACARACVALLVLK